MTLSVNEKRVERHCKWSLFQQILLNGEQVEMFLDTLVDPYIVRIRHFRKIKNLLKFIAERRTIRMKGKLQRGAKNNTTSI